MAATAPSRTTFNPLRKLALDMAIERAAEAPPPAGATDLDLGRTRAFARDPLGMLLDSYERWGPIFTLRVLHANIVFMLGPAANHYVTVSHADNFAWRDGSMGDLIPLLGDGMLTIDGDYHRRARRIMLPAFHRERIAAATTTMVDETLPALEGWRDGQRRDVYTWTRRLALRIAMRALFGLDPDRSGGRIDVASEFEHALGFYGRDYLLQILRGPRTPWARMHAARRLIDRLLFSEIEERRADPRLEERADVLSLLISASDEDGAGFSDQEVRDQMMTLLFAGHDTTTSTISFLLYELARAPEAADRIVAELDAVLDGQPPTAAQVVNDLPELEMAMDETLRLYPAAWIGPRRARRTFEFDGHTVAGGMPVNYCSWASHHLPDVFEDPEAFRPSRFSPEAKAALPKGAYIPFGGGSRTCIGMRFGQMEIKTIAALVLQRFRLRLPGEYEMSIRQMPTLSPRGGLPMIVEARS